MEEGRYGSGIIISNELALFRNSVRELVSCTHAHKQ